MASHDAAALINVLGFLAGTYLYAMLLAMVLRGPVVARIDLELAQRAAPARQPPDRLPLVTAVLGLLWNVGALVVDFERDFGGGRPNPVVNAASLVALGFLPAVVVHLAVQSAGTSPSGAWTRLLPPVAYGLSSLAAVLQFAGAASARDSLSFAAMVLLTTGFGVLMGALLLATRRERGLRRTTWAVALAVFAVSAFHLSQHSGNESVWVALLGHHASLPLAVAILYQDYRFALVDTFLKRALSLVAVVALAFGLYVTVGARLLALLDASGTLDARAVAGLVGLWVVTALAYPLIRDLVGWFVDTIVLQRVDYDEERVRIAERLAGLDLDSDVLATVCDLLAPAIKAPSIAWRPVAAASPVGDDAPTSAVTVAIPVSGTPRYVLEIPELGGGRRLLSDDIAFLESVALVAAQRIDAVRLARERLEREVREQEISKLAAEAELRALQAQLNPHFLFNALTTIGYLIRTAPERAVDTLMRLTELLRSVLKRSGGDYVTLGEEVGLVETYLEIERARFEERLAVSIDVPDSLRDALIPPLTIQPLVENAVKHGIAPCRSGGTVAIEASRGDGTAPLLVVTVRNSGAPPARDLRSPGSGVGMTNIRTRLERYFGPDASLQFEVSADGGAVATLRVPLRIQATPEPATVTGRVQA